jgi:hypothetical protein
MPQAELDQLYQAPAAEFRAGMGFDNKEFWRELAGLGATRRCGSGCLKVTASTYLSLSQS